MNRDDRDLIEGSYDDLNPVLSEQRERDRKRDKRVQGAILAQRRIDGAALAANPQFLRWLFTALEGAGIWRSDCHAHDGSQYYDAGRRALGLELLNDLETCDPNVMIALMVERRKTLEKINAQVPSDDE